MSERFSWKTEKLQHSDDEVLLVVDNENKDWKGHILNIVRLLNEQQKEINDLHQENADLLGDKIRSLDEFEKCTNKLKAKILHLQEENEALKKFIKDNFNEMMDSKMVIENE